jgi:thymidylate kinase
MSGTDGTAVRVPLLSAAFDALDRAGFAWALLRDSAGSASSGDEDMLVEPAAAGRLDILFARLGYRRLPAAGQGSHRFYLGYDADHDRFVTLDVVTEVAFGRRLQYATSAASALLARARRIDSRAVLHPDDAFWHLLLHYLLDKPAVPRGGHERLAAAAAGASATGELAAVVDRLRLAGSAASGVVSLPPGGEPERRRLTAADVLGLVRRGDSDAVESLAGPLRRAWRAEDRRGVWARIVRSRLERFHLTGRAGPPTPGTSVAILGPDGAGKTTLAHALAESVPLPARQIYMGVWREYPWDRWLKWIPGARLTVRMTRLATRSLQCRYYRRRGRLVLLDRFTYDAALPSPDLDWRGRITLAAVRLLSSDPDLVLVLDAPPEVMYARKGEQGVPVLARDRGCYLRLAAGNRAATVIDATLPPARVRTHAHRALWRTLAAGTAGKGTA